jgi:hypothetical protein
MDGETLHRAITSAMYPAEEGLTWVVPVAFKFKACHSKPVPHGMPRRWTENGMVKLTLESSVLEKACQGGTAEAGTDESEH